MNNNEVVNSPLSNNNQTEQDSSLILPPLINHKESTSSNSTITFNSLNNNNNNESKENDITTSSTSTSTTNNNTSTKINGNNLFVRRIPLGDRRRTYEDEVGKANAIKAGGSKSNSTSNSSEIDLDSDKSVEMGRGGSNKIRSRNSSQDLRSNYTDKGNDGDDEKEIPVQSTPIRPSPYSAPNSNCHSNQSQFVPEDSTSYSNTEIPENVSQYPGATIYTSEPFIAQSDGISYGPPLQHPLPISYQNPNYYPPVEYSFPSTGGVPILLSPINTNLDPLQLHLQQQQQQQSNFYQTSPTSSPYTYGAGGVQLISPNSIPYPSMYPIPLQTYPNTASSGTPNLISSSGLYSEEISESIGGIEDEIIVEDESSHIIYGSDGEPTIGEEGEGIGLTGMDDINPNNNLVGGRGGNQNPYLIESTQYQPYNIHPQPLLSQTYSLPPQQQQLPYFSPPHPQHQHLNLSHQQHQQQQQQQFNPQQYPSFYPPPPPLPPFSPPYQHPQFIGNLQQQQHGGPGGEFNRLQQHQPNQFEMNNFLHFQSQQSQQQQIQSPLVPPPPLLPFQPHIQQSQGYSPLSNTQSSTSQFSPLTPFNNLHSLPQPPLQPYPHPVHHNRQQQQYRNNQSYQQHQQQQRGREEDTYQQNRHQPSNPNTTQGGGGGGGGYSTSRIYVPPSGGELSRGSLAQAKFYDEVYGKQSNSIHSNFNPIARRIISTTTTGGAGVANTSNSGGGVGVTRNLPRPPVHSPHALWVGNVPSDATHVELWQFFTSRSGPASSNTWNSQIALLQSQSQSSRSSGNGNGNGNGNGGERVDYTNCGVESIHLIARSNCAFVNYASDVHLQHAIAVSHGISLRPQDPRCKDLVCRVRKRDEDTKSGVGAQRTGGMHHTYLANQREAMMMNLPPQPYNYGMTGSSGGLGVGGGRVGVMRSKESFEGSIASTSSSFLGKYFAKRFFILKSLNERDLHLSVKTGLWATQTHNESVLDQAFRSCKEGVYLIFGANKTGEWFGYAKMTGPVTVHRPKNSLYSNSSKPSLSNSSHSLSPGSSAEPNQRPSTIPEDSATDSTSHSQRPPLIFSPSEKRLIVESPAAITPSSTKITSNSTTSAGIGMGSIQHSASTSALRMSSLPDITETIAENLHIPAEKRADSLDPKILDHDESNIKKDEEEEEEEEVKISEKIGSMTISVEGDEIEDNSELFRRETLPTAEARNAILEKMSIDPDVDGSSSSIETQPFKVEWIKVYKLPFHRTRHLKNAFNSGKECKVSRDGTEVDPISGELLLEEFWKTEGGLPQTNMNINSGITIPIHNASGLGLSSNTRVSTSTSGPSLSPMVKFREVQGIGLSNSV